MRLTQRCTELLGMLRVARWLTTGQIHRRFFAPASVDAARKRLRKLVKQGYLFAAQPNRMHEALFTLGPEGKRLLERDQSVEVKLERSLPKQLEHFIGINDLRIGAEQGMTLDYFFACWELPGLAWRHGIIPDAVLSTGGRRYALEFDRGQESIRYFVRTKIRTYLRGIPGFPLTAVLIITDRKARMDSLARSVAAVWPKFLLSTVLLIRDQGFWAQVFFDADIAKNQGMPRSLLELSCRQDRSGFKSAY